MNNKTKFKNLVIMNLIPSHRLDLFRPIYKLIKTLFNYFEFSDTLN